MIGYGQMIFCDMDQVLVNFLKGARLALGREFNDPTFVSDAERWALLRAKEGFWLNLEWMPQGQMLWNRIAHHEPHILSASPKHEDAPTCRIEKKLWCGRELIVPDHRIHIVNREEKKLFAIGPDGTPNVLCDDHKRNVLEWREAGGIAIEHHSVPQTIAELEKLGL